MSNPLDDQSNPLPVPAYQLTPKPIPEFDDELEEEAPSSRAKISPSLVWRAFRRHWWQVLLLWGIGSAVGVFMALTRIKPTYEAVARVRVEPGEQSLYTAKSSGAPVDYTEFKEMQASTVTSPVVLSLALTEHPELYRYPKLQNVPDAELAMRQFLRVSILPKQSFIEIAMTSTLANEAVDMVNAVLEAYLKNVTSISDDETKQRIAHLKKDIEARTVELELKRAEWKKLSDQVGAADVDGVKDSNSITTDDYRLLSDQLSTVEMERVSAQAELDHLRGEKLNLTQGTDAETLKAAVEDAFQSHPKVAALQAQIEQVQTQIEHTKRKTTNSLDPARMHHAKSLKQFKQQMAALRTKLWPRLEREVMAGVGGQESDHSIAMLERQITTMSAREEHLREKLNNMKLRSRQAGTDSLQLAFARYDSERAATVLHKVEDTLNQLEHEARSPIARVRREFPAKPIGPNGGNRTKMMLMAPVGVFLMVLSVFVLIESSAGRVANPEDLRGRARLQVLGVVPPLPALRGPGSNGSREEDRAQRLLDEFVQSLDHLRVTLCARPDPWGRDRHCILITSACGSEGKTTLAAQLAERCANAGLSTLLIDADLRNPTLTRMLDSTENDGLTHVLRGEVSAERAIRAIDAAGGFHFLPAGTARIDPSRLLQGSSLGSFIAQARETFEMILVDAPPVLPVPDSLMIGRWTDGAVLAVRYDNSRFAAVERAHRRLQTVGVPVIGAVVNGVRGTGATYGGGYYAYGSSVSSESSALNS